MKPCRIHKDAVLQVCKHDEPCRYFKSRKTPERGFDSRSRYVDEVICENDELIETGNSFFAKFYTKDKRDKARNEKKILRYLEDNGFYNTFFPHLLSYDEKSKMVVCKSNDFVEEKTKHTSNCINKYAGLIIEELDGFKTLEEYKELSPEEKQVVNNKVKRRIRKLHRLGVSHGDLFKQNILYKKYKGGIGVRLIDFAKAKIDASPEDIENDNRKLESRIIL